MMTTKCDICKKSKKKGAEFATLWFPVFSHHDVCMNCIKKYAGPFLKKLEVVKERTLAERRETR